LFGTKSYIIHVIDVDDVEPKPVWGNIELIRSTIFR